MKYKEASTSVKTPIVPLQLQFYFPELQGVFQHKTSQNSLVIFASEGKSGRWGFVVQPFKNTHTFPSFYKATPYHDWALYLFVLRPPLHLYLSFCYFLSLIQFLCEPRREIPVEKREGDLSACLPALIFLSFRFVARSVEQLWGVRSGEHQPLFFLWAVKCKEVDIRIKPFETANWVTEFSGTKIVINSEHQS